jgi:hypothetical protein
MYAKNLAFLLHEALVRPDPLSETLERFERLRGFGLLPRGRENAAVRLSDMQIASAVLGFAPTAIGFAGYAALCLGGLRAVGGPDASFRKTDTLQETIATILGDDDACKSVVAVTLTIDRTGHGEDFHARLILQDGHRRVKVSYVDKMATRLVAGAGDEYDHDRIHAPSARQLTLGPEFFLKLRRDVVIARELDLPLKTDWTEYDTEEQKDAFHRSLGARPSSRFLNLPVDTAVAWPKEPTLVKFAGYKLVVFPRTTDHSHSISIDLTKARMNHEEARTLLNRFLSMLAWCQDQHAILGSGWSGNPVPVPVRKFEKGGTIAGQWAFDRSLPEDPEVLQRLAYYREGLNAREAGLVSYQVLSFFKVFEQRVKSEGRTPNPTKPWIRDNFEAATSALQSAELERFHDARGDTEVHHYIFGNCRVATAHASERFPSDADASVEIQRLYSAAGIVRALARYYLKTEYSLSDSYFSD